MAILSYINAFKIVISATKDSIGRGQVGWDDLRRLADCMEGSGNGRMEKNGEE